MYKLCDTANRQPCVCRLLTTRHSASVDFTVICCNANSELASSLASVVRRQKSGVRSPVSVVRRQKSGVRSRAIA